MAEDSAFFLSAGELLALYRARQLSPVEVVEGTLRRLCRSRRCGRQGHDLATPAIETDLLLTGAGRLRFSYRKG